MNKTYADRAVQCAECGGVIRKGQEIELMRSADNSGWLRVHPQCPKEKEVREVNLPQRQDATDLYWELACTKCGITWAGKYILRRPARCPATSYTRDGNPCGGVLVRPAEDDAPYAPWDELPKWMQEKWESYWMTPNNEGRFPKRPPEERIKSGAPDHVAVALPEDEPVWSKALRPPSTAPGPDDDIPF